MDEENKDNVINITNNIMMKKSKFIGLLVILVSITSISSFFIGTYTTNLDADKNMQFNFDNEIPKLESQSKGNPIVAEVNGQKVRVEEVKDVIKTGFTQGQMLNSTSALDMIITKDLLLEEAQNRDITITMSDAEKKLTASYVQKGLSKEQFEEKLGEFGTTYDQTLERFREELIINELLTNEISKIGIQISDEEAKTFFDNNKEMIKTQVGNGTVFDDVSSQIKTNLLQQKQQQLVLDFIENLKSKATIITYQEMLQ